MRQYNVEATKAKRAQARIEYQRARGDLIARHNQEQRDLRERQEQEAASLWRAYCEQSIPVVV